MDHIKLSDLPGVSEFQNLFANFRVDKIETYMQPMWETQTNDGTQGPGLNFLGFPNLIITKVNTKWLSNEFTVSADAATQRDALAQLQAKSVSTYGSRRPLKLVTYNPKIWSVTMPDPANPSTLEKVLIDQPWLSCQTGDDHELSHHTVVFGDRIDGEDNPVNLYKYRVVHKIWMRFSQVG